jgi:hypothetical protein
MTKGPDLSAFPIPRKGGAKPLALDEVSREAATTELPMEGEQTVVVEPSAAPTRTVMAGHPVAFSPGQGPQSQRAPAKESPLPTAQTPSGQTVATTVKLDENRYLRLADAGKPRPGRLKRRTIQEMVIEALDEWFERRGI